MPLSPEQRSWLEALRSGDYRQAKGHLRHQDTYCCLGVACDVSGISDREAPEGNAPNRTSARTPGRHSR